MTREEGRTTTRARGRSKQGKWYESGAKKEADAAAEEAMKEGGKEGRSAP